MLVGTSREESDTQRPESEMTASVIRRPNLSQATPGAPARCRRGECLNAKEQRCRSGGEKHDQIRRIVAERDASTRTQNREEKARTTPTQNFVLRHGVYLRWKGCIDQDTETRRQKRQRRSSRKTSQKFHPGRTCGRQNQHRRTGWSRPTCEPMVSAAV